MQNFNTLKIDQLKAKALQFLSWDEVGEYGDRRFRDTWIAAIESCKEQVAAWVDQKRDNFSAALQNAYDHRAEIAEGFASAVARFVGVIVLLGCMAICKTIEFAANKWKEKAPLQLAQSELQTAKAALVLAVRSSQEVTQ